MTRESKRLLVMMKINCKYISLLHGIWVGLYFCRLSYFHEALANVYIDIEI